jgi:hypothetical protein
MIETYLTLTDVEKLKLLRWYVNQGEPAQLHIHHIKRDLFYRFNEAFLGKGFGRDAIDQACLVLAARQLKQSYEALERKGVVDLKALETIRSLRVRELLAKRKNYPRRKAKRLEAFQEEIKALRGDGLSWRNVSRYLAQHHKMTVSHTYLRTQYQRMIKVDAFMTEGPGHE